MRKKIDPGFLIWGPNIIVEKIKSFYSKYPLVRYAGEKQLTSRAPSIIILGILFVLIELFCLW